MSEETRNYLRYSLTLEHPQPDEAVVFDEWSRIMQHITRTMARRYRHAYRPVHTKSHGVVVGTLSIASGLPEPLRPGLFAAPGSNPVIMRFSTNPGDLLADDVSSPQGLAVEISNVDGETVASHTGQPTPDLMCIIRTHFQPVTPRASLNRSSSSTKIWKPPRA